MKHRPQRKVEVIAEEVEGLRYDEGSQVENLSGKGRRAQLTIKLWHEATVRAREDLPAASRDRSIDQVRSR